MFISLHDILPYIGEVSLGFININTYEINIIYDDNEKKDYCEEIFIPLPYIDSSDYRNLKNSFLMKFFKKKKFLFLKMNNEDFEHYFHIMINDNMLNEDWYSYEDEYKLNILVEWCNSYNIKYTLKK